MALVFAKNSGLNDDLWKVNDQIVRAVLQDTDNETTSLRKTTHNHTLMISPL